MSFVFPELPSWLLHDISPPFEYVRDTDAPLVLDSHMPSCIVPFVRLVCSYTVICT